jgi:quercetin dioxygenase-like cupin family protein
MLANLESFLPDTVHGIAPGRTSHGVDLAYHEANDRKPPEESAMSAVTPKATNHAGLAPLASRFVDVPALAWERSALHPGVETKTLLVDRATGLLTMLLRMAPGAKLPDHEHVQIEQTYVLDGTLVCGEGVCRAGEFVWRPAGSRHEAWAGPEGGLMLAMFLIPNRFFGTDGRSVDFLGQDWEKTWGEANARQDQANFA